MEKLKLESSLNEDQEIVTERSDYGVPGRRNSRCKGAKTGCSLAPQVQRQVGTDY